MPYFCPFGHEMVPLEVKANPRGSHWTHLRSVTEEECRFGWPEHEHSMCCSPEAKEGIFEMRARRLPFERRPARSRASKKGRKAQPQ